VTLVQGILMEPGGSYGISSDGQRFLMIKREQDLVPTN